MKLSKNLPDIQNRFYQLKTSDEHIHTPIGRVAEIVTQGFLDQSEVNQYLKKNLNAEQKLVETNIKQNWHQLSLEEMISFLTKVFEFRNTKKNIGSVSNPNSQKVQEKQKIKKSNNKNSNQNLKTSKKKFVANNNMLSVTPSRQLQQINQLQEFIKEQEMNNEDSQKPLETQDQHNRTKASQSQNILELSPGQENRKIHNRNFSQQIQNSQFKEQFTSPPAKKFKKLLVQERYTTLSEKYTKNKNILEKKFDLIYKHYRKQMYIPYQSFEINNQLLMDLRIFLKYYRQFQIAQKFKINDAVELFKKIALNGLWLDEKNFIQIHYRLAEMIDFDEKKLKQFLQNSSSTNPQKLQQKKIFFAQNVKILQQNLFKLNQLSKLISEDKIKTLFNSNNTKTIKKIVEIHSGLTKEDVLLKLKERVQERKFKKNLLFVNSVSPKFGVASSEKSNSSPSKQQNQIHSSPNKLSIYEQLELPKLRSRELRNSSVYSSLQIVNIQKQKEKLKELVNEGDKEKYLQAFFKKQKILKFLGRSNSVVSNRPASDLNSQSEILSSKTEKSKQLFKKEKNFPRNVSLPRIKAK